MASFIDRLLAYLVDIVIVSVFLFVINQGVPSDTSEIDSRINEIVSQYTSGEMEEETFLEEYKVLLYDLQKENKISTIINVAVFIAYFIIFQYMMEGRTIGKKLFHLRITSTDDEKPTIWQMILRSLFMFSIVAGILYVVLLYVLTRDNYATAYLWISGADLLFLVVSLICILYRKDKRGLHDMMANTKVIKEV